MKKYRCVLLDFSIKNDQNKIVFEKYVKGLKAARALYNIPISYSYNCKCFTGWKGSKNYLVSEI